MFWGVSPTVNTTATTNAVANGSSQIPEDVLPEYFPRKPAECRETAELFFNCFNENSKKVDAYDKNSGVRGLVECKTLKLSYEECMSKLDKSKLSKRFEVSSYAGYS